MSRLLDLPNELIAHTFSYVDRPSLKSLRQTCRFLSQLANDQLYRTVHLRPGETSQNKIQGILNNPSLSRSLRKIDIVTVDKGINYKYRENEQEWPHGWDNILAQVEELPLLNSVVLCFHKRFVSASGQGRPNAWDYPQTRRFRFEAMDKIFSLIDSSRRPVQSLGIRNLQAVNPEDPRTLAKMEKVLSGLQSLRLSITNQIDGPSTGIELEFPEVRNFLKDLPSAWLRPAASSLRHLSLSWHEYFGFYPHMDITNLFFPHLKTLSLGHFCFYHDDQIDWILRHSDTLEEIYLDGCAVLYDFGMLKQNVNACGRPRDTTVRREGSNALYGSYDKRWHEIFDLFAEKLTKLRHFRIGRSDWYPDIPSKPPGGSIKFGLYHDWYPESDIDIPFKQPESGIRVGLYHDRYMPCYDGLGDSPYQVSEAFEYFSSLENWCPRPSPECDDEDRASLRKLLAKLGQSVQESYWQRSGFVDHVHIVDLVQTDT
ncbi:hypothetical protein N7461_001499 [Penicillium sp. DV-2018c]|nr:hypothetical protein N7461_001499 [Penicillium sp. DV-2018c]